VFLDLIGDLTNILTDDTDDEDEIPEEKMTGTKSRYVLCNHSGVSTTQWAKSPKKQSVGVYCPLEENSNTWL